MRKIWSSYVGITRNPPVGSSSYSGAFCAASASSSSISTRVDFASALRYGRDSGQAALDNYLVLKTVCAIV